jgi:hypothetical protein
MPAKRTADDKIKSKGSAKAAKSPESMAVSSPQKVETSSDGGKVTRQPGDTAMVPPSPVLHGLKYGCKRKGSAMTPLSGPGKMHRRMSEEGMIPVFQRKKMTLVLDDGTRYEGYSFGAERSVSGEVVFNTAMVGYPEALTDPSYRGQLLTCTYPLIGNYGVPPNDVDDTGMPVFFESKDIHISALIVSEYSADSCHWNQDRSLGAWLKEHNVRRLASSRGLRTLRGPLPFAR